jgi:hypothetical protein
MGALLARIGGAARALHVLLLAAWLGGAAYHFAVVIPSARAIFATRDEAMRFVGLTLSEFDRYAIWLGPGALLTLFLGGILPGARVGLRAVLTSAFSVACLVNARLFSPRVRALEVLMPVRGPQHVTRGELEQLYLYVDSLLIVGVALAIVCLVLAVSAPRQRRLGGIEL